jgi:hypothetical protein
MLVRDAPVGVDFAQSDCQPEEEPAFLWWAAECAGAAAHDGDGEGDILAGRNCELFYVECLRRLVVSEEQNITMSCSWWARMPKKSCRRTASAHASISTLIWLSAVLFVPTQAAIS